MNFSFRDSHFRVREDGFRADAECFNWTRIRPLARREREETRPGFSLLQRSEDDTVGLSVAQGGREQERRDKASEGSVWAPKNK
jgi:hypothetical protein